ncbi:MAG: hypothetical protein M3O36_13590 [Myxococcota bacterium]|nr:hypothetical protein [Myxococcota bacterium]
MSTTTSKPNKAIALARVQALIAGTQKHFPASTFTFGNTAYTTAALIQAFEGLQNAIVALNAAQAGAREAGMTLKRLGATIAPLLRDYRRFVLSAFGTAPQQLADFGLQPPKAHKPLPSDKRAAATAKMRATRAARGTESKKKKLAVKGNVTGVDITPITSHPVTSPTAPPASNASSAPTTANEAGATK